MSRSGTIRWIAIFVVAALVVSACGTDRQPDAVMWRNIDIAIPDGWYIFEHTSDRLSIANVDLAAYTESGTAPDDDVVAMFFTHEPATLPADWRALLDQRGAHVETDDRIVIADDIPATRLIYAFESAGVPTREMVVLVPSRQVVVLAQPVPRPGQPDGPEVFLTHLDTFLEVVTSAQYGRPLLDDDEPS